jgi:hypothetical protein
MLFAASPAWAAASGDGLAGAVERTTISGVVKDAQGVAQMGALVQILAAKGFGGEARTIATAFTDMHGRYTVANLIPGRYQVRASAALFVPSTRSNLLLHGGSKAVVDLTLSALFDTASWLPASRRRADEPQDDWQWTLRSTANRPILRIFDQDGVVVVTSVPENPTKPSVTARDAVAEGTGFGEGGVHDVLSLHRSFANGQQSTLRADIGTHGSVSGGQGVGAAVELEAGLERKTGYGGGSRTVVGFASHPELIGPNGAAGVQMLEIRSGEQIALGENVDLELGGEMNAVRSGTYAVAAHPFIRVTAHNGNGWRLQYRMATSRQTQEFGDVQAERERIPAAAATANGKLTLENGRHQEITISKTEGRGVLEVAYFHDALQSNTVAGSGGFGPAGLGSVQSGFAGMVPAGVIADPMTGTFQALAGGYSGEGARISVSAPLTHQVWIAAEYTTGVALASETGPGATMTQALSGLNPRNGQAAAISLRGDLKRSGTRLRTSYRWQPEAMVTAIDPYGALSDEAYLSCFVRQRIRGGGWVPHGLDATIDVSNLLAQGYRPFLSADGRTLYFAQAPRSIQAGLSFTF